MNQRNENISALLDNQLDEQELQSFMQDLKRDLVADGETVQRYQMIGEVMRGEMDETAFMDISAAVHRAVEQEPPLAETPLAAPKAKAPVLNLSAWLKPLSGLAIAASVAMITVVSLQTVKNESAQDMAQPVAQLAPSAAITPVNQQFAQHVRVASTAPLKPTAEQNEQLNEYLINHAGQSSMQGVMPYVRVINLPAGADQ